VVWWRRVSRSLASLAKRVHVPGWLRTALGIVILSVVIGFFGRQAGQTVSEARQTWQPVSWLYVVLSFSSVLISLLAMALMWHGLLRTLDGHLPALTAVRFYGLTLLPRYVPGMVWGYVGRTVLCERAGVPRKTVVESIIAEVGLILGSGAVVIGMKRFGWGWGLLLGMPSILLLTGGVSAWLMRREQWVSRFVRGGIWWGWMLAYVAFWLLYGLSTWFAVLSVAPEIATAELPAIIVSTVLAWLGGFIVILVPGGLGIRESVFALTLTPMIGPAKGLLVPLLARLIGLSAEAVFFGGCLLLPRGGALSQEGTKVSEDC